jgi:hypothetical protein
VAAELLVASNPSGRKKRRGQSPKQRAASLRNLKKARRAQSPRRRSNPVAAANPSRRRKRRAKGGVSYIKRRRNPGFSLRKLSPRGLVAKAMPALVGGGGAVANDLLYNAALNALPATFAPDMVENLRTGMLRHVGKAASAILLTMLAGFVLPRRIAEQMGTGALTVVGYNVVREGVTKFFPDAGMGLYLEPAAASLGWAGAGWNPQYGGEWRSRSGLAAYLKTGGGPGNGGLTPTAPFKTGAPYASRAPVYADELDNA